MGFDMLVVDDSPVTRKMVRRAIGLSGIAVGEVREASNGAEALEAVRARPPAVVIADINMPVMTGLELVERMAADPALAGIPVVVVATPMSEERASRLLSTGARAYLAKPFRPEQLRDVLAGILGTGGGSRG